MRIFVLIILFLPIGIKAQFAPAAGKPGSSALRGDSSCFVAWATFCTVKRGLAQINEPDSGFATVGNGNAATGPAKQNGVVSLGDGGTATLTFLKPIINGNGWDFAVFENSFLDSFLELAFVEVSTDGERFVRFPTESLTDTARQTAPFGATYPEKLNNLAGKYVVGFGTPFDLEELKDSSGIDINDIRYVRIVDVIGTINPQYATRDSEGRKVNDPWPTPWASSGFDLDAVGVINQGSQLSVKNQGPALPFQLHSNPTKGGELRIEANYNQIIQLYSATGQLIQNLKLAPGENCIKLNIPEGIYYLRSTTTNQTIRWMVQP